MDRTTPSSDQLIALATATEDAAISVEGITNSKAEAHRIALAPLC